MKPTLQLNHPDYDHIFAIGDVAHTTAIKAGHVGYWQAGVAVENIVKLLEGHDASELKQYEPTKPMIKVTVGKVGRDVLQARRNEIANRMSDISTRPSRRCGTTTGIQR